MDKKIFANSGWILSAQVITKIVSFFYTIFLARQLGVSDFGQYIVALTYFSLISSVADFGVSRFLIREISKDGQRLHDLISPAIFFRLVLMFSFFIIFLAASYLLDPDATRRNLIVLAVLAALPQGISLTLDCVFVSLLKIKYSAIGILLLSIFTAVSGFILINLGLGVFGAVIALALGQILYALSLVLILVFLGINWKNTLNVRLLKELAGGSLPYGVLGILGLLYFKIDALMLSYLKGAFDTGIYGAAYKFLEAVIFIPAAFATVLFPVLARQMETDRALVEKTYYKSLKMFFLLSIFILFGYLLILPVLINIYLPQYQQSIQAIKILALAIPFLFIHTPGVLVLLSTDKFLKIVILLSLVTVAFNVVVNLILIPPFGFIGASVATVASEILSFIVFYILLRKRVFKR